MCRGVSLPWAVGRGIPSPAAFLGIQQPLGGMWGWGGLCALGIDGFASVHGSGSTSWV